MGKKRKWLSVLLAIAVTVTTPAFASIKVSAETGGTGIPLTDEEVNNLTATMSKERTSVHDPSIVKDKDSDDYYVFGSHMGVSKSSDLMNWTSITAQSQNSKLFGIQNADGTVSAVSFMEAFKKSNNQTDGKDYNIAEWIYSVEPEPEGPNMVEGNMWAPDVIYNEAMQKYCMYLSLNGDHWNSSIILLTADDIDGPYVYEAPIVFSGFSADNVKSYKYTDLEKVLGNLDSLPDRYRHISGSNWISDDTWKSNSSWGEYLPHAIDPAVFYDEAGKLWMVYGSWSGGIFMLELDETTGLRDYAVEYDGTSTGKDITSDPYFGTKIAGGNYVSGEGPYIEYIDGYYYLFLSYGFYSPEGGYNMRIFRSEAPDGPYTDENGNSPVFNSYIHNYNATNGSNNRGMKLIGNYKWNTMDVAEIAQGHNSAFVDDDGKAYVVYHTKFADGTASHEVRVHELYMNEDGWPVAAPYEYDNRVTIDGTNYSTDVIAGDYDVIVHDFQIDYASLEYKTPVSLTLEADGTVTGAYTGTWVQDNTSNSVTIELNNITYKGVFVEQIIDGTNVKTMCFTIVNENGLCVWGSKIPDDSYAIAQSVKATKVPGLAFTNITLPTEGIGNVSINWSSDNIAVLADNGELIALPAEDTTVNLTATYSKGDYYYNKSYLVNVYANAQNEDDSVLIATYFEDEDVELSGKSDGSLFFDNPFSNKITPGIDLSGGVTITFDVDADTPVNVLGTIFAFTGGGKFYFTPGSYLGYNATGGWFDANMKDYKLVDDYIGTEKATVSICITATGFSVSINGIEVYNQDIRNTANGDGTLTDYTDCLTWLNQTADKLYFGYGSWWTDVNANCTISNFKCYANPIDLSKKTVDEITYTKDQVVLASNDTITYEDNPFYGKHFETFEMEYTINLKEGTPKLGWDGIFSFYNSETGTRVSVQTAPYICYNAGADSWMDINQPPLGGDNAIVDCTFGEDYTFILTLKSSGATMTINGEPLVIEVNSVGATYTDVIKAISKCDKLTWGVGEKTTAFWDTEQCTLSNIRFQSGAEPKEVEDIVYDEITLTKDEVNLTAISSITREANPFYEMNIEDLKVEYTITLPVDAVKTGWDGIFSFYNSKTGGRISFQTAPYICYNTAAGTWMDFNYPIVGDGDDTVSTSNELVDCETDTDYTFAMHITNSDITITLDGEPVEVAYIYKSSPSVSYSSLISYISKCDEITWGVGANETSYWATQICSLKNIAIWSGERQYPDPILVTDVSLNISTATLLLGETKTLNVTVTPDNADNKTVEWTSTNEEVATVSSTGVVTALKVGTTEIIATVTDGSEKSATCIVTVNRPADPTPPTPSIPKTDPAPEVIVDNDKNTAQVESKVAEQKIEDNKVSTKVEIPVDLKNSVDKDKNTTILLPSKELLEIVSKEDVKELNITVEIPTSVSDNVKISNIKLDKSLIAAAIANEKVITAAITDETGELLCEWTFDGTKAADSKKVVDVNLWMNTKKATETTAIKNLVKKDTNNKEGIVLDFSHSGTLPANTKVSIKVDSQMFQSGDKVYMYYYNSKTKKLEELPKSTYTIDKNGFINANLTHCSQYVLLEKKADSSILTSLINQVSVKLSKTAIKVNQRTKINLMIPEGSVHKVTYSSSKKSVAAVSKKGSILAKKKGSAVIAVKVKINGETKVFKKKITVN